MNIEKRVKDLLKYKKAYYDGEPEISDAEFDKLEDELRKEVPDNAYFNLVGSTTPSSKKVKHEVRMRSMKKANSIDDVEKWIKNTFTTFPQLAIQPKIDGFSVAVKYKDGKFYQAATRGNGSEGQDISIKIQHIPSILKEIPCKEHIEIRGEMFLPKDTKLPMEEESPLRNLAVGIINRKDEYDDCKYLSFIGYEVVGKDFASIDDKFKFIINQRIQVNSPLTIVDTLEKISEVYTSYETVERDEWNFETDGLIIQPNDCKISQELEDGNEHHPKWAVALKPTAEEKETELLDVEWNVSYLGNVVPTAIFKPVIILGAQLQRATVHNYETLKDFNLKKGDSILVSRSNDVIPFFVENLSAIDRKEKGTDFILTNCPSCNNELKVVGVHLFCDSFKCPAKQLEKIVQWVQKSEMVQVSGETIRLLFDEKKIKTIKDLYHLKKSDLENTKGLGEKKINNLLDQIEKSKTMSAPQLIAKLDVPLCGLKSMKKLEIETIEDFLNFNDPKSAVGRKIIEWKKNKFNVTFLEELVSVVNVQAIQKVVYKNGSVCFTGSGPVGRKELIRIASDRGYEFIDGVKKELNLLVCEDKNGSSSKLQKARKLGIKIISYDDFLKSKS